MLYMSFKTLYCSIANVPVWDRIMASTDRPHFRKWSDFSWQYFLSHILCFGVPLTGIDKAFVCVFHRLTIFKCLFRYFFYSTQLLGAFNFLILDASDRKLITEKAPVYSAMIGYVKIVSGEVGCWCNSNGKNTLEFVCCSSNIGFSFPD